MKIVKVEFPTPDRFRFLARFLPFEYQNELTELADQLDGHYNLMIHEQEEMNRDNRTND